MSKFDTELARFHSETHLNIIEVIFFLLRLLVIGPQRQVVNFRTFAQIHSLHFVFHFFEKQKRRKEKSVPNPSPNRARVKQNTKVI